MRRAAIAGLACLGLLVTGCGSAGTTGTGGSGGTGASADNGSAAVVPAASLGPASLGPVDAEAVVPLSGPAPVPQLPVTVDSADGRRVTVTDTSRVIALSLSGSLAETVVTLGLGDRLVGRDISSTFPQVRDLPLVTRAHDVSAEGVLGLDPTLLLVEDDLGPQEALEQLRSSGVPVVEIADATTLDEVGPRIRAVANALGVPGAGERLVQRTDTEVQAALAAAPADGPRPRIAMLYLRGSAGVYLMAGEGSGADSMIRAIGAEDAGTDIGLRKFRPITSETLVNAAPDVFLLMTKGLESVGGVDGLLELPGFAQTPAGQARRIVTVDDQSLLSFGPRTGAVIRDLAQQVYG